MKKRKEKKKIIGVNEANVGKGSKRNRASMAYTKISFFQIQIDVLSTKWNIIMGGVLIWALLTKKSKSLSTLASMSPMWLLSSTYMLNYSHHSNLYIKSSNENLKPIC